MLFCYECVGSHFGICTDCCNEYDICLECINLEYICPDCENNDEAIYINDLQYFLEYIHDNYHYFNDLDMYEEDYDY